MCTVMPIFAAMSIRRSTVKISSPCLIRLIWPGKRHSFSVASKSLSVSSAMWLIIRSRSCARRGALGGVSGWLRSTGRLAKFSTGVWREVRWRLGCGVLMFENVRRWHPSPRPSPRFAGRGGNPPHRDRPSLGRHALRGLLLSLVLGQQLVQVRVDRRIVVSLKLWVEAAAHDNEEAHRLGIGFGLQIPIED